MPKKKNKKKRKRISFQAPVKSYKTPHKRAKARKISGPPMIVDNEPIRSAAHRNNETIRARMEAMEQKIESFERQELPAYQRWVHLNFGPQLTEIRETELTAASLVVLRAGFERKLYILPLDCWALLRDVMRFDPILRINPSDDQQVFFVTYKLKANKAG